MGIELDISDDDSIVVTKEAAGVHRDRLRNEAEMLARAAHPGVAEFLTFEEFDDGRVVLRTSFVGDQTWQTNPPQTPEHLANAVAFLAATLADLHQRAIVHSQLRPEHLVFDAKGRPLLCDFSESGDHDPSADILGLGQLLQFGLDQLNELSSLPSRANHLVDVLQTVASQAMHADPSRRPSARAVAAAVTAALSHSSSTRHHDRPRPLAVVVSILVIAVAVAVVFTRGEPQQLTVPTLEPTVAVQGLPTTTTSTTSPVMEQSVPSLPQTSVLPPAEALDELIVEHAGIRYAVGESTDRLATGDWNCDGQITAAVLRPYSGEVYVFEQWPESGEPLRADALLVPNTAADVAATTDCGYLALLDTSGKQTTIRLEQS